MDNFASVRLIDPLTGASISIPLPMDGTVVTPDMAANLRLSLGALLGAGFSVTQADKEGGNEIAVTRVLRGQRLDTEKNVLIDRLYFYEDGLNFKSMTVYMDTAEERRQFEAISGLKINDLPIIEGKAAPQADEAVFANKSRPTNFRCIRKQAEGVDAKGKSHPWKLVSYIGLPAGPVIVQRPPQPSPVVTDPNDLPIPSDDVLRAAYPSLVNQLPGDNEATKKKNMKGIVWRLCQGTGATLTSKSDAPAVVAQVKLDLMPRLAEAVGK